LEVVALRPNFPVPLFLCAARLALRTISSYAGPAFLPDSVISGKNAGPTEERLMNLLSLLREQFRQALAALIPDPAKLDDYLAMVRPAQNAEHGDYQANFAMPLNKLLKRKTPKDLAEEIAQRLPLGDMLERPTVAHPGFINVRFRSDWLAKQIQAMARDERLGIAKAAKPRTFVIDYSAPNVAKPLHVGHLRSTIIGESLKRLLRFLGHTAIADNHLGDWGTQFGMLLYGYKHFRDEAAYRADPVRELARLYKKVRELAKANDEDEAEAANPVADAYRQETVKLHQGDPENVALWKQFMPHCLEEVRALYRRLDVHFDHEHGESFYQPMLARVVADLLAKTLAFESEGAVVIPNAKGVVPRTEEERKKEDPPALVRKRDGAFTYTTSDLATIKYRVESWTPDAILYVVDARQALHFRTFFAEARRWGYERVELTHVSFGSVLGEDGKPLKTREGAPVELEHLLDEAVARGLRKYDETRQERIDRGEDVPELTDAERREIAAVVGIGAVKYADLSQNRTSDYVFSFEKMLATDGNTATYMQYAYVRCRGIFRKGDIDAARFRADPPPVQLDTAFERSLASQLLRYGEALEAAADEYMSHFLTAYLWDLAKAYSGFFVNCPVLKAETPELRDSRLLLCDLTARVIRQTLELLGIKTVERM
jgi:arginyl-tRNA synthetase